MAEPVCRVCGGASSTSRCCATRTCRRPRRSSPMRRTWPRTQASTSRCASVAGCGLVQLAGEPVPYYRERDPRRGGLRRAQAVEDRAVRRFIDEHGLRGKRVVEVGCGRGEFLSLLQPLDVEAFGLEYSEGAVAECAAAGLRVSRGLPGRGRRRLGTAGRSTRSCCSCSWSTCRSPGRRCAAIADNLARRRRRPRRGAELRHGACGRPVLGVRRRPSAVLHGRDAAGPRSRSTASTWLDIDGVRATATCSRRRCASARRLDVSGFDRAAARADRAAARLSSPGFAARGVAVWGAGHQAFATIALTGIAGEIRYVVDSAPFKQGRFTPATHLPIVAPEALETDPVDAVIVMAASYSDEVAHIVRERFGPDLAVAIVRESGLEPGVTAGDQASQADWGGRSWAIETIRRAGAPRRHGADARRSSAWSGLATGRSCSPWRA